MSGQVATGMARKLKKVLEARTDSPDLLASLGALSVFYSENSAGARKGLRSTIERRGLAINEEFLAASEAAQMALDVVDEEVQGLAECCERIAAALEGCTKTTGDMVIATERLKQELETTLRKQDLVLSFLRNYQLSPAEIRALRDDELNEEFFAALSRVHEIHANCKMLLRTHHQRAGLELMDVMAVYQEGAYERLCRWVQAECRSLGDEEAPEVSELLKAAARCLKDRPVLFKYCAEEVANSRHNALFRRFISALTRGGPGGMPRPIEVHAHDPLRYTGDMLAWLHQALASEKEMAAALFGAENASREEDAASKRFSSASADGQEEQVEAGGNALDADVAHVLDRIFEGVCRPFKVRVEQILTSSLGLSLSYKICNLLRFYGHTISELLGMDAALVVVVAGLLSSAEAAFSDLLKARGEKLLRYPPQLHLADLSPPPAVAEAVVTLTDLLGSHASMMVPAGAAKPDFGPVISGIIDPLLQMCERAAESLQTAGGEVGVGANRRFTSPSPAADASSSLTRSSSATPSSTPSASSAIRRSSTGNVATPSTLMPEVVESASRMFLINSLAALHQGLSPYSAASSAVKNLDAHINAHISALVALESSIILTRCQLSRQLNVMRAASIEGGGPLATREETSAASIAEAVKVLFGLLVGADGRSALPEFIQIQLPKLRADASTRVAQELADAYAAVYQAVLDPSNEYPEPRSIVRHTPDQLRTLLGI